MQPSLGLLALLLQFRPGPKHNDAMRQERRSRKAPSRQIELARYVCRGIAQILDEAKSALIAGRTSQTVEALQQSLVLLPHRAQERRRFAPVLGDIMPDQLSAKDAETIDQPTDLSRFVQAETLGVDRLRDVFVTDIWRVCIVAEQNLALLKPGTAWPIPPRDRYTVFLSGSSSQAIQTGCC
jgi:hypothetical protein